MPTLRDSFFPRRPAADPTPPRRHVETFCAWMLGATALLAPGCSSRGGDQVLAQQTVGPEGATLTVAEGPNAGLTLTLPAGAMTAPVVVSIVDDPPDPLPGGVIVSVPPVGFPFRIEPRNLALAAPATLAIPCVPERAVGPPGNLVLSQERDGRFETVEPDFVDVVERRVEATIDSFGAFLVVNATQSRVPEAYLPTEGVVQELDGGWTFAIEPIAATSAFANRGATAWRLRGPGFDESWIVSGDAILGRETAGWTETWMSPQSLSFALAPQEPPAAGAFTARVDFPGGAPSVTGSFDFFGIYRWAAPRVLGQVQYRNVLEATIQLRGIRPDISPIDRTLSLWTCPDIGVLALRDGDLMLERRP